MFHEANSFNSCNGNSFDGDQTAATLAPPFQWGQPIPDMRLMGQR